MKRLMLPITVEREKAMLHLANDHANADALQAPNPTPPSDATWAEVDAYRRYYAMAWQIANQAMRQRLSHRAQAAQSRRSQFSPREKAS